MTFSIRDLPLLSYVKAATTLAPLVTAASAWAQEANNCLSNLDKLDPKARFACLEAMEKGGATPGQIGRAMIDMIPGIQDQTVEKAHSIDLAAVAHDVEVNAIPWGSIAIVVAVLLVARMIVHYPRWMSSIRASSLVDRTQPEQPYGHDQRFTLEERHGMPVWRMTDHRDSRFDGMHIVLLPEGTDATSLGSLPEVMTRHEYETIAIGARGFQVGESGIGKGLTASRTYEKAAQRGVPRVVSELISEAISQGHRHVVLTGYGGQGTHLVLDMIRGMTPDQKRVLQQVYAIAPEGERSSLLERFVTTPLRTLFRRHKGGSPYNAKVLQGGVETTQSASWSTLSALRRGTARFASRLKKGVYKKPPVPVTVVWPNFGVSDAAKEAGRRYLPTEGGYTHVEIGADRLVFADRGRGSRDMMALIRRDLGLPRIG